MAKGTFLVQTSNVAYVPADEQCTGNYAASGSLSKDGLQHFTTYKYSSVDKSPLSNYVLKHYVRPPSPLNHSSPSPRLTPPKTQWNFCVQLLPLNLAPNMVTLLGFLCIIFNVALLSLTDPGLVGPKYAWISYSYGLGVWAYSTMDNIDGKQARRTGTSSGLGELFDHGIDSLNCTLASLLEVSAMGLGPTKLGAFTALVPCLPMFFSTWETYHTHTLYLGYFNGPTEGLAIASLIAIVSGYYGHEIWHTPIELPVLGVASAKDLWVYILLGGFFIAHLPSCVLNVAETRRKQGKPLAPLFLEWTPMLVYCVSLAAWLGSPYSSLLTDNHLCLLCLTLSFVFGRMTTKIILAHLTRQPFPYWTGLLLPLMGGAVLANLPFFGFKAVSAEIEYYYLLSYFIVSVVVYFRWAYLVINAICDYLGIQCLTIPEDRVRALKAQQKAEKSKRAS